MPNSQPQPTQERRTNSARREAFSERDRSKRLGLGVPEPKSGAKQANFDTAVLRMI